MLFNRRNIKAIDIEKEKIQEVILNKVETSQPPKEEEEEDGTIGTKITRKRTLSKKEKKGYLEITSQDFYFNQVRPYMEEMTLKCKTDEELLRTLDKVINAADSFVIRQNWVDLSESFELEVKRWIIL